MNHATSAPPILLAIAGFDPSAGAGVAADLKTFAAHNCYGVAAVTAITVQSTKGVESVQPTPPDLLRAQLDQLVADVSLAGVKIGMLATRANVEIVAELLERQKFPHVVLDPILRSSSGFELLEPRALKELTGRLFKLATVITPNMDEAAALAGIEVRDANGTRAAAQKLVELGARAVVITGGHLEKPVDLLYDGKEFLSFGSERVRATSTHGTGCTFASAIAANLALGKQLPDAVMLAKAYVAKAIEKGFAIGKGPGPLNHFHRFQQEPSHRVVSEPAPVQH